MSVITKTLKFTGGVLLGLGVGSVTALLLAPQSGEVSKDQIRARLDEIRDAGQQAQRQTEDDLQTRWEQLASEGKDKADEKMTVENKAVSKAEEAENKLREKRDKERRDVQRHIEKADKELEKARTKI
ncbi:MAG: YtxH domain-containing protein [Chloroflexia bacterium]